VSKERGNKDWYLFHWLLHNELFLGTMGIGLVNTVENSIETNEEVGSRKEPGMMFDEYGQWVKLVSKRINDGFENRSREKKHCIDKSLFVF
jgi:hypothetical protein